MPISKRFLRVYRVFRAPIMFFFSLKGLLLYWAAAVVSCVVLDYFFNTTPAPFFNAILSIVWPTPESLNFWRPFPTVAVIFLVVIPGAILRLFENLTGLWRYVEDPVEDPLASE